MDKTDKIYVAGHSGLFGGAILRTLKKQGYENIVTAVHSELDLCDLKQTKDYLLSEKPRYVFFAAGKVGGISVNSEEMADFTLENTKMAMNIIECSHEASVKKLLYLGSSCIYPFNTEQPIKEEALLTGRLEPTNEGYALAKIIGIKLCEYYRKQYGDDYISCIPANVYGPGDNFSENRGHVIPSLIKKMHFATIYNSSTVSVWGSGKPRREFLFVDDAAEACINLMMQYSREIPINIGVGEMTSIREVAELIAEVVGFNGELVYDYSKPDGMYERMLDCTRVRQLGWRANTALREGLLKTYEWFLNTKEIQ